VVSRSELLDNVFQGPHAPDTSLVRVHVSHLRRRLGTRAALKTIRGRGYVLEAFAEDEVAAAREPVAVVPVKLTGSL
jgi:DNA-binding winged helix-turn-helix (wHTH) protein